LLLSVCAGKPCGRPASWCAEG